MNNDDMPLSIYGLRPGSYITMKVNNNPYRQYEVSFGFVLYSDK